MKEILSFFGAILGTILVFVFIIILFCQQDNVHITQYSNGVIIGQWDGTNGWQSKTSYFFKDKKTGKNINISGQYKVQEK